MHSKVTTNERWSHSKFKVHFWYIRVSWFPNSSHSLVFRYPCSQCNLLNIGEYRGFRIVQIDLYLRMLVIKKKKKKYETWFDESFLTQEPTSTSLNLLHWDFELTFSLADLFLEKASRDLLRNNSKMVY